MGLETQGDKRDGPILPADDPFVAWGLGTSIVAETTIVITRVRLLNTSREPAIIEAEAGAGRVVVDTVEAGDSVEVNLLTRADSVRLTAVGLSGSRMGDRWIRTRDESARAAFP
jgi:hypothetical protein